MRHCRHHRAFSLFEVLVCIVLLGIISVVCGYILLDLSKNLALQQKINDQHYRIALLKLENIMQTALAESISVDNKPLDSVFSQGQLYFISFDRQKIFGGGDKTFTQAQIQNGILMPAVSLSIDSHSDSTLSFKTLYGWHQNQKLYLISNTPSALSLEERFFAPNPKDIYTITHINTNTLTLDHTPEHTPRIALPLDSQPHKIEFKDRILWLDDTPIALNVSSFSITPHIFTLGENTQSFLEFTLCYPFHQTSLCESGGIWLESIVDWL
ncbi:prepilin-type N-terminal cleavage/methylation domain-containing protein [Helicobacter sp. MIT 05-5293]|uniref:type II secretion system protein n=1 Tax=Helicobacter sp. MIT 05-5293 TaxID=1548149 RepID=UPI000AF51130|nr:prepilin-type N-terminal cleavage/methylation domain-containing protein [Helicobacter sp. MIT 05-5293]TLD80853.1 prepilin-type N-terminal cleavage/methylation domain-containing protein [Helicobacter sp. MIT 05-5293]